MLQQTQVERVIPFYKNFLTKFPTVQTLAQAPLAEVLVAWQGLGYNRRAKMLHQAAKEVVDKRKGKFPKTRAELEALPGIGPYTAGAVAAFAYNEDGIFIETNIRTALIHYFSTDRPSPRSARAARPMQHLGKGLSASKISDKEIIKILEQVFPKGKSREWYSALMDYGAHLKKQGVKLNAKSEHYAKQSQFKGSLREARGAILRALAAGPVTRTKLIKLLGEDRQEQVQKALKALLVEGFVVRKGHEYGFKN